MGKFAKRKLKEMESMFLASAWKAYREAEEATNDIARQEAKNWGDSCMELHAIASQSTNKEQPEGKSR